MPLPMQFELERQGPGQMIVLPGPPFAAAFPGQGLASRPFSEIPAASALGGRGQGTGTVVLRILPGANLKNSQGSNDHASDDRVESLGAGPLAASRALPGPLGSLIIPLILS